MSFQTINNPQPPTFQLQRWSFQARNAHTAPLEPNTLVRLDFLNSAASTNLPADLMTNVRLNVAGSRNVPGVFGIVPRSIAVGALGTVVIQGILPVRVVLSVGGPATVSVGSQLWTPAGGGVNLDAASPTVNFTGSLTQAQTAAFYNIRSLGVLLEEAASLSTTPVTRLVAFDGFQIASFFRPAPGAHATDIGTLLTSLRNAGVIAGS